MADRAYSVFHSDSKMDREGRAYEKYFHLRACVRKLRIHGKFGGVGTVLRNFHGVSDLHAAVMDRGLSLGRSAIVAPQDREKGSCICAETLPQSYAPRDAGRNGDRDHGDQIAVGSDERGGDAGRLYVPLGDDPHGSNHFKNRLKKGIQRSYRLYCVGGSVDLDSFGIHRFVCGLEIGADCCDLYRLRGGDALGTEHRCDPKRLRKRSHRRRRHGADLPSDFLLDNSRYVFAVATRDLDLTN